MLLEESLWFKNTIHKYITQSSLVLNIGSSSKHFIEVEQPYIKKNLIDELIAKQCTIKNIDIRFEEGVDIVGDVTNTNFIRQIKNLSPDVIICSNLLEHLEDRTAFCAGLSQMMGESTLLIVSVPYKFPYHEDPIDTLFRPNLIDLQKTFNSLKFVDGRIVDCGTYHSYSSRHLKFSAKIIDFLRISRGLFRAYFINKERFNNLLWYYKKISASCAIFRVEKNL